MDPHLPAIALDWRTVGRGARAHAFTPGEVRYAYCGIGPGDAETSTGERCRVCLRRLDRITAQERADDRGE